MDPKYESCVFAHGLLLHCVSFDSCVLLRPPLHQYLFTKRSKLFKTALKKSIFMLQRHGITVNGAASKGQKQPIQKQKVAGLDTSSAKNGSDGTATSFISKSVRNAAARSAESPRNRQQRARSRVQQQEQQQQEQQHSPHPNMLAPGGGAWCAEE